MNNYEALKKKKFQYMYVHTYNSVHTYHSCVFEHYYQLQVPWSFLLEKQPLFGGRKVQTCYRAAAGADQGLYKTASFFQSC